MDYGTRVTASYERKIRVIVGRALEASELATCEALEAISQPVNTARSRARTGFSRSSTFTSASS